VRNVGFRFLSEKLQLNKSQKYLKKQSCHLLICISSYLDYPHHTTSIGLVIMCEENYFYERKNTEYTSAEMRAVYLLS
jgi:uncharacterized short protein YbdD (DUF466 family)